MVAIDNAGSEFCVLLVSGSEGRLLYSMDVMGKQKVEIMIKLEELNSWLSDLRNLITDVHIAINNAKYLLTETDDDEDKIKKHGFFVHHTYQLRFIIAIQLCKLFDNSSNQRRNIVKLCNRLINENYDSQLSKKISDNKGNPRCFQSRTELISVAEKIKEDIEFYFLLAHNVLE